MVCFKEGLKIWTWRKADYKMVFLYKKSERMYSNILIVVLDNFYFLLCAILDSLDEIRRIHNRCIFLTRKINGTLRYWSIFHIVNYF